MIRSYLPRAFQIYSILFLIFLFLVNWKWFCFFYFFIYLFLNYAYRRKVFNEEDYIDTREFKGGVLCPISGVITKLYSSLDDAYHKSRACLEIKSGLRFETGLYLPTQSEVKEFIVRSKDGHKNLGYLDYHSLKQDKIISIAVVFREENGNEIILEFPKRLFFPWPRIWMMPGDRGKIGVNIGHLPFGGKVLLYLPKNYEILTTKGNKVKAKSTLIAAQRQTSA